MGYLSQLLTSPGESTWSQRTQPRPWSAGLPPLHFQGTSIAFPKAADTPRLGSGLLSRHHRQRRIDPGLLLLVALGPAPRVLGHAPGTRGAETVPTSGCVGRASGASAEASAQALGGSPRGPGDPHTVTWSRSRRPWIRGPWQRGTPAAYGHRCALAQSAVLVSITLHKGQTNTGSLCWLRAPVGRGPEGPQVAGPVLGLSGCP